MAAPASEQETARRLTTHVLDMATGRPAAGVRLRLSRLAGERFETVATAVTNADGRCDPPLLVGRDFEPGAYEILFEVGSYFKDGTAGGEAFLDVVPIRFVAGADVSHLHVPLLIAPFGYSTYRGS